MMNYIDTIKKDLMKKKRYEEDVKKFKSLSHDNDFEFHKTCCIYEDEVAAAVTDPHYFLMDLYFAKIINKRRPTNHYDIGSRVDGFIAHLLASEIPVTLLDIRPFPIEIEGLSFVQTDATSLKQIEDDSLESISSLHAIEHFGLGRYGDFIEPQAWKTALKSIQSKVKPGGFFYLGIPIGNKAQINFNMHRVFTPNMVIQQLDSMELVSFAYINNYRIINVEDRTSLDEITSSVGAYDCGLFCFKKTTS